MDRIDITKLYEKQISLTEWFEQLGVADTQALRQEDNNKRERMAVLQDIMGLPFDRPTQFSARDVADRSAAFEQFLAARGDELCALRLIPRDPSLPKLRMRGYSIRDSLNWFAEQGIDPDQYKADFVPHPSDHIWSTIFVVNEHGIFGEIIRGAHNQLTQGFHDEGTPIAFAFDFSSWQLSEDVPEAQEHLIEVMHYIYVPDVVQQRAMSSSVQCMFAHDYLCGYFETVTSSEFGIWFIDYNRILGERYQDFQLSFGASEGDIHGQTGSRGRTTGRVRIIRAAELDGAEVEDGEILVTDMTTPDFLPLMLKAGAIVTDLGGILTHAAIVARELKKPCVVGTRTATTQLHDGDIVEVDADAGIIRVCS